MKYLINSADFTKFDYKFNKFVEKYKNDKNINKINIYYRKFRKFCFIFKNKNTCKEIISQLHKSRFWKSKISYSETFKTIENNINSIWTNPYYWHQKQICEQLIIEIM